MEISELKKLGLSDSEARLYLVLLKVGAVEVQKLVEETGLYKANVYESLERLCDKGIISKVIENGKRVYQLQKPEALIEFVQKKKTEVEEQEQIAKKLAEKVKLTKKHIHTSETANVFRGFSGVKQIYSEIIEEKLDYLVFGSPKESEMIGEYYWKNLHAKQKENRIKARMIFNKSLRSWKGIMPKDITEVKFFDEEFEPLTETTIYGNKIAFVIWTEKPVVTIINNEHVTYSYRQIFELLWKQAKT
ncbi:hypothetical protein HYU23_04750 [Candidatus Woesearchaeota archaeon]|nr:hypothetical protein [Candidatus Woesearchaeota archaeon]